MYDEVIDFAIQGMADGVHPLALGRQTVARMTNCRIHNQLPTTRFGFRALRLGPDADEFKRLPVQGGMYFNPARGQSQIEFSKSRDLLVVSAGGKKFSIDVAGRSASVSDETGPVQMEDDTHLVWMFQAENFIIAQDGVSDTWIWDGASSAFRTNGYSITDRQNSRIANAATAGGYMHGRIVQVIDGRKVIVGDIIHRSGINSPEDILKMTEQVYYATGAYFSPPSGMGDIMAVTILPLRSTIHGHDDCIIHCKHGIFSLKLDHYPRSEWVSQAISRHLLLDTAASGPYAVILYDGDQMFRSKFGIQTLKSAAAEADVLSGNSQPLSDPVRSILRQDHPALLKFASMAKMSQHARAFCTTGLWLNGKWRGGRGIISLNMNPDDALVAASRAWEGLWTLPRGMELPVQFIDSEINDEPRLFLVCCSKNCGEFENSLVEVDPSAKADFLPDGSSKRISSQLITGAFPRPGQNIPFSSKKTIESGRITFSGVEGCLEWGIWLRGSASSKWIKWGGGTISAASDETFSSDLSAPMPVRASSDLSAPPSELRNSLSFQALIRWRGYASLESLAVRFNADTSLTGDRTGEQVLVEQKPQDYNDFEYSTDEPWPSQD